MIDAHVVLAEQLVDVDRHRRLAHARALHGDRWPCQVPVKPSMPAHLAVAAGVVEERLRDPLRPQRVAGQQDGGRDVAGLGADVGAHAARLPASVAQSACAASRTSHLARQRARPGGRAAHRRGLARRALGRPGDAGAGRRRHPDPPGRRRGRRGSRRPTRRRRPPGAARRARRRVTWFALRRRPRGRAGRPRRSGCRCARCCRSLARRERPTEAPLRLPRDRAGRVALRDPVLPALRRRARAAAGRRTSCVCTTCGQAQFPRTDPAVIMAITHGEPGSDDEALLLGRQAAWPAGPLLDARRVPASRARPSRTPYAARSWRRSASASARSPTSATSPGRCRPA